MGEIWYKHLPFPPSVNKLFRSGVVNGRVMRFKTRDYRSYEESMKTLRLAPFKLKESKLALSAFFYADHSLWFTKDGNPRIIDLDNRLKALLDVLSGTLGFDDKWIFEIHAYKCVTKIGNERVDVLLSDKLTSSLPLSLSCAP